MIPFQLKTISLIVPITPIAQILLISGLYVTTTLTLHKGFFLTPKPKRQYSNPFGWMFAPIYEEVIFGGLILFGLLEIYTPFESVLLSSLFFGLWHFKNIFVLEKRDLIKQMLYTGLVFGPVISFVALKLETIWVGVVLHYINNLLSVFFRKWVVCCTVSERKFKTESK